MPAVAGLGWTKGGSWGRIKTDHTGSVSGENQENQRKYRR